MPPSPQMHPKSSRNSTSRSKSCANLRHHPHHRNQSNSDMMKTTPSSRDSDDCCDAPNMRERFNEESLRGFNKYNDYPRQAGVCGLGLGLEADQGSNTVITAPRESDGQRQPLIRSRSASNPVRKVDPTSSRHCRQRVTAENKGENRYPAFDVFIGDDYTTITFRRARNHPCAFEVETCHPHDDTPYSDGTPWIKECDQDDMANKTLCGVSRSSSTHQHGMKDPMASPHMNGHRCSMQTGDSKYHRRTTAFDAVALQYRRQGNIFTDADIESILRGGAKSSPSPRSDTQGRRPSSATVTATAGYRNPAASRSFPEMRDKCSIIGNGDNGSQNTIQDDGRDPRAPEKYVYRSRRTSVQYGKRHRSLSRERRERDKSTTMRYEPSCAAVGSRYRNDMESFPVIVIPERGLSLQENRQKSHEQSELHEDFMKGQVGSSLAQDLNARTTEQVARRRNTTANVKSHTSWVEHNQPRVSKSILARIPVGRTATDDSSVYSSHEQAGECLSPTHLTSGNALGPVKPQWVDEADRGRTRRNRVAIARRNTLNRWKPKMGSSSTENDQEVSPRNPPNELTIQAFVTNSSDDQDSDPETAPFQRPRIGRVSSSKPLVVNNGGSRKFESQAREHTGDANRAQDQPSANYNRAPSVHRTNFRSPSFGHLRTMSTPQSSRCASLVEGFGKERSASLLVRGRAHSEQQEQPIMPSPVVPRDIDRRSEQQVPDNNEDTEPDTDSPPREIRLDQTSDDEFQFLIQEQVSSSSPPVKTRRQVQVESVYHTPHETPTDPTYRESQANSCSPLSGKNSRVSDRPLPRAAYHRSPQLHIDTQLNGSHIAPSVTSSSTTGDLVIAPSIQSWANKSDSWVEICEASAVTITNHHPTTTVRPTRNSPPATQRIDEVDEGETKGEMSAVGDRQNAEQEIPTAAIDLGQQRQSQEDRLTTASTMIDEDRNKRRSEVHWIDREKDAFPTQRQASRREPERYRVYDDEGMKHFAAPPRPRHSIQVDSQHRISTTTAADMAERDVGSPLEYLRRSLQPGSRRASWTHGDDASSIARNIQRTQRRLEGCKSPPGPPHTFVRDPRISNEDPRQCIWKRMGRKGLQVLTFGRAGSQRSKAESPSDGAKTPRKPTRRESGRVLGSVMRRMSTRLSRRDKAEEETRAAAIKAGNAKAGKSEGCFERGPKDYRGRLQRSLSRASRRLRRRKD